jgi:hypothetical protein
MIRSIAAAGALLLALMPGAAALDASPAQTAEDFYRVYATFHPSDGIPDAAALAKYAPYLSPALEQLLAKAGEAEKRFHKKNKNSPPLIEGDLFTALFEGATSFHVGACKDAGDKASCAIALGYDNHKDKPAHWTDTLYLVKTKAGWRVDDVGYGANWDFANKGRLRETLLQVLHDVEG